MSVFILQTRHGLTLSQLLRACALILLAGAGTLVVGRFLLNERLLWACESEGAAEVRQCLSLGADPNAATFWHGFPALYLAARREDVVMIRTLLGHGARPPAPGAYQQWDPVLGAIGNHRSAALVRLIEHGARVSGSPGGEYVGVAVKAADLESLKVLLAHGASLDQKDEDGRSPLEAARYWLDAPSYWPGDPDAIAKAAAHKSRQRQIVRLLERAGAQEQPHVLQSGRR